MTHNQSQVFTKFCAYMAVSLVLMVAAAYFTAFTLLDFLADIAGGKTLGIWLTVIFAGAVTAFVIRKSIWRMETSSLIILLVIYSLVEGMMFSVLFLGESAIAVVIVSVIFIVAALSKGEEAVNRKGDASQIALAWTLSVYLNVMMVISLWVLIWGAWDTTRRRYMSRKRRQ